MYKVAILGVENTHADNFLKLIYTDKVFPDVEVVGVYSHLPEASARLQEAYGVPVMDTADALVGKVDGVILTARHGSNHYLQAKPYIASGIPMFIDKPAAISEEEAVAFMQDLKANGVKACGGSMCVFADWIQKLKKDVQSDEKGRVIGGYMRAPMQMVNPHGNFHFYCQHLVQTTQEIFGYYPKSVIALQKNDVVNCTLRYEDYDVNMVFLESRSGTNLYYAGVNFAAGYIGEQYAMDGCAQAELQEFVDMLHGAEGKDYRRIIAPVFIHNAIVRSLESGKEEPINPVPEI